MNFIKRYFGFCWLTVVLTLGVMATIGHGFMGLKFMGFCLLGLMIINIAKPDAILTTEGGFGILKAKIWWNFGAQFFMLIVFGTIFNAIIKDGAEEQELSNDIIKYCSEEQMKLTGTKACNEAKEKFIKYVQTSLPDIKDRYKIAKNEVTRLSKDKDVKCSEKGLTEYGSDECERIKKELEEEINYEKKLNTRINNMETQYKKLKS